MLNERFGDLLPAAMDRETHHCVRLFDEPDAREALASFGDRKNAGQGGRVERCRTPPLTG